MILQIVFIYILVINIISFFVYFIEGRHASRRLPIILLVILPIIGGSFGACVGNYFFDTEYKELRYKVSYFCAIFPPILFFVQLGLALYFLGAGDTILSIILFMYEIAGILGYYLLIINLVAFVFVIIRKYSYYIAPVGKYIIPDFVLIPALLLGGAPGGVLAKFIFNFKEDWSCNATKKFQNFIYNYGMFIICAIQIAAFFFFTIYIR